MFRGSKHCPRCGAAAVAPESAEGILRQCPRCRIKLNPLELGKTNLNECPRCEGLWVDVGSFEKICADREQQSAVLGNAVTAAASTEVSKVKYVPCPDCSQLMNRMNFARCSGVIVDVCKRHGSWFDRNEISRIIEFIRGGGLQHSREKEKLDISEERERLRLEQLSMDMRRSAAIGDVEDHRITGIASARSLLKFLLD